MGLLCKSFFLKTVLSFCFDHSLQFFCNLFLTSTYFLRKNTRYRALSMIYKVFRYLGLLSETSEVARFWLNIRGCHGLSWRGWGSPAVDSVVINKAAGKNVLEKSCSAQLIQLAMKVQGDVLFSELAFASSWFFFSIFKLKFSKKATKNDKIFTVDLTLCSKRQIDGEDFVNFRVLLRKYELYL